jgi:6-phosphogluconolactonase
VADRFLQRLAAAQGRGETPNVALTGGTVAEAIHRQIAHKAARLTGDQAVDWDRVVFWWGDERFVAPDSDDRNARDTRASFLDVVGATHVHEIPSTADAADVDASAAAYSQRLRDSGAGEFDLVMLGMGPDGHVASLFPGFPQLDADGIAVGVTGSPKPPPERVSLTFGALNRARAVWFVVTGDAKADAVHRALADDGDLHETPARGIQVVDTTWFLDTAAASRL